MSRPTVQQCLELVEALRREVEALTLRVRLLEERRTAGVRLVIPPGAKLTIRRRKRP